MASFSVVSNISSANAQANLSNTQIGLNKALTRLSSGFQGAVLDRVIKVPASLVD